ncbi:MAG: SMP-30/gluconolactonase/LRE family protein [Bacteroidales bacterium]|nr:SMP-30/gluconolactonase/LRE family protein [Bacteroidales bacterium]
MSIYNKTVPLLLVFASLSVLAQETSQKNLYRSSVFTPVNSSTSGVEGPGVDKNGTVYYVNYAHEGTIGQVTPDGKPGIFVELPQGSVGNGIRFDNKGNMLIADYTMHNILKVNMADKKISVFAHEPKMSQPNDIAIDSKNRLFASDPDWERGTGRIWRIDVDGKVTLLDSLGTANGIEVSPDEKTLYVNAVPDVWAYDLSTKGDISNKRLLIRFPDFIMDGMRCDIKGNLYIARFGKGVVAVVSPEGKLIREIMLTGKKPTNVAFGGKDGCTVYVTLQDQGNLESFRTDTPGREWKMQTKTKTKTRNK